MNLGQRVTIAHFNKFRTFGDLLIGTAVVLALAWLTFFSFDGHLISRAAHSTRGLYVIPVLVMAWISCAVAIASMFSVFRHFVFDDGRALWIEDGVLVNVPRWYTAISCDQIADISLGQLSRRKSVEALIILEKDGSKREISTRGFAESGQAIVDTLSDVLRLPKKGSPTARNLRYSF
jgi:hypothetical protein